MEYLGGVGGRRPTKITSPVGKKSSTSRVAAEGQLLDTVGTRGGKLATKWRVRRLSDCTGWETADREKEATLSMGCCTVPRSSRCDLAISTSERLPIKRDEDTGRGRQSAQKGEKEGGKERKKDDYHPREGR